MSVSMKGLEAAIQQLQMNRIDLKQLYKHFKCLLLGPGGTGKTYASRTLPHLDRVMYCSCESGCLSISDVDFATKPVEMFSWEDVQKTYQLAKKYAGEIGTVYFDSLTESNELCKEYIKQNRKEAKETETLTMQEWGLLDIYMRKMIRGFRNLPVNVIFTCHPKRKEDSDTGETKYYPALNGQLSENVHQFFDFVFFANVKKSKKGATYSWLTGGHDRYMTKDRSGKLKMLAEPNWTNIFNAVKGATAEPVKKETKKEAAPVKTVQVSEEEANPFG